jgi:hypothetical protein
MVPGYQSSSRSITSLNCLLLLYFKLYDLVGNKNAVLNIKKENLGCSVSGRMISSDIIPMV